MKAITNFKTPGITAYTSVVQFRVQTIQSMYEEIENIDEQCRYQDYYQIIWIVQGTVNQSDDMQKSDIDHNRIFCIKPGQMHPFLLSENTPGFIISFTEAFINIGELEFDLKCQSDLFQLFLKTDGIRIKNEMIDDMREIVSKMIKENDHIYLFKTEIIKRYLKIFLIYLTRHFHNDFQLVTQSRNMEIVQTFMRLLERNFKEKKMVTEYASDICVTPNYLNEIIKKMTGYSAGYHIRQRVVLEAKRLALYSGASMKEIAYELGFLDSCHFSKFFKTVTGSNFSDFKKEKIGLAIAV